MIGSDPTIPGDAIHAAPPIVPEDVDDLLARACETLNDVGTTLARLSPPARDEVTRILAEHGNHGGWSLLIDTIQLDTAALRRRPRNH